MEEEGVLRELGLTDAEAKVYLALLGTGASAAGPVIKKAGLHRATTYQILQRLSEKGLVSSIIQGKKRQFLSASPRRLMDVLRQQEERLQKALPKLEAMLESSREKQEVAVYSGVNGIRSVLDCMLDEVGRGGKYCDFGVSGLFYEKMGAYWWQFQEKKRRMRISSRVIFNSEAKTKYPELIKNYVGARRFHPSRYPSITDTFIYKDTVALIIWTATPPIAVVVKNADNARGYLNQFELMWKAAKT